MKPHATTFNWQRADVSKGELHRPGPGRPFPKGAIAYKESVESKRRRLNPPASTTMVVEPAGKVMTQTFNSTGVSQVEPTLTGSPAPPQALAKGGDQPTEEVASTQEPELKKCQESGKMLTSEDASRKCSVDQIADLPDLRAGSSAPGEKPGTVDLLVPRTNSSWN